MPAPLKIGLNICWVEAEHLSEYAQLAESLGYESLWSGEHVCLSAEPNWWKLFPGAEAMGDAFTEDMVPFTPDSMFPDPMIVLAQLAAVTTRSLVVLWPLRDRPRARGSAVTHARAELIGRAGRSDDVAGLVRYPLSANDSLVTRQVVDVAGGQRPAATQRLPARPKCAYRGTAAPSRSAGPGRLDNEVSSR